MTDNENNGEQDGPADTKAFERPHGVDDVCNNRCRQAERQQTGIRQNVGEEAGDIVQRHEAADDFGKPLLIKRTAVHDHQQTDNQHIF